MSDVAIYVLIFVLAASADFITMIWHSARERGDLITTSSLSMVLEAITWTPVLMFVYTLDWYVALLSVIGSGLGTALGMFRIAGQDSYSIVEPTPHTGSPASSPPLKNGLGQQRPPTERGVIPGFIRTIEDPEAISAPTTNTDPVIPRIDTEQQGGHRS